MFSLLQRSVPPIPCEDTFYGNDDVFTIWSDRFEKDVGVCLDVPMQENFAFLIEDAEVHGLGMKIDTAEKFVLLGVKSHLRPPWEKGFGSLNHTCFGYGSGGP